VVHVKPHRFSLQGRERVTLGIRPAHLRVDTNGGRHGGFSGEVQLIEYLGNEVLVNFGQDGSEISALMPSAQGPQLRERVSFVADPAAGASLRYRHRCVAVAHRRSPALKTETHPERKMEMKALVLEKAHELTLRDVDVPLQWGRAT
jgi:hypothetical protein